MNEIEKKENMIKLSNFHIGNEEHKKLQIVKAVEELASVNKMLCKYIINSELGDLVSKSSFSMNELLDELFDAEFMIFQLKRLFLVNEYMKDKYELISSAKLERELKRWDIQ